MPSLQPNCCPQPMIEPLEPRQLLSGGSVAKQPASPPRYDHVVIVMEENHSYGQVLGPSMYPPFAFSPFVWVDVLMAPLVLTQDTYIQTLARHSAVFTNSHALTHPSQPNYLELFSGSTQGVNSDGTPRTHFTAPNLGGELIAAGRSFVGYSEGLPRAGYAGDDVGDYARRHAPWVNFTDIPASSDLPFARFPGNFNALPTVSFVIPNLQHDMHSGSVQDADQWLQDNVGAYAKWAAGHNSLLIVTWDEDNGTSRNHIPTVFFGAHIRPGPYGESVTHDRVLRTLEDMFALPYAGNSALVSPITDVFV
jgi:hypothetical protein